MRWHWLPVFVLFAAGCAAPASCEPACDASGSSGTSLSPTPSPSWATYGECHFRAPWPGFIPWTLVAAKGSQTPRLATLVDDTGAEFAVVAFWHPVPTAWGNATVTLSRYADDVTADLADIEASNRTLAGARQTLADALSNWTRLSPDQRMQAASALQILAYRDPGPNYTRAPGSDPSPYQGPVQYRFTSIALHPSDLDEPRIADAGRQAMSLGQEPIRETGEYWSPYTLRTPLFGMRLFVDVATVEGMAGIPSDGPGGQDRYDWELQVTSAGTAALSVRAWSYNPDAALAARLISDWAQAEGLPMGGPLRLGPACEA